MATLGDAASLFMDMDHLFKEEQEAATLDSTMDAFPASSLELVQLLACDGDDAFMDDGPYHATQQAFLLGDDDATYGSPTPTDDLSDAVTDVASEMSSPPPSFDDHELHHNSTPASPAVYGFSTAAASAAMAVSGGTMTAAPTTVGPTTPATAAAAQRPLIVKLAPPSPIMPLSAPTAMPTAAMLPFAFPVACFPTPLNMNQKRPLPDVLPTHPAAAADAVNSKKSKREIRQMKNRESANRSRLRRKAQLSDLSGEVDELMRKQHELQNTIAGLQAENKSLHDQNAFLRSLVTMYSDPARAAALPPVPSSASQSVSSSFRSTASLSDLESGHHKSQTESLLDEEEDDEDNDDDDDDDDGSDVMVLAKHKKPRKSIGRSAATVSAASLGFCASVFGLTILADSENGATQSSHIRRPGRVLHSLPSTTDQGCSPSPIESMVERLWEVLSTTWAFLTTSDLAYGVFLNVLSFIVIMGLYHCFQQYVSSQHVAKAKAFRWESLKSGAHRETTRRNAAAAAASHAKRRSVSWQDVRIEAAAAAVSASATCDHDVSASATSLVHVFT